MTALQLRSRLGFIPETNIRGRLRRNSRSVAACFLRGFSHREIASALGVDALDVEDALRWELKRREASRG